MTTFTSIHLTKDNDKGLVSDNYRDFIAQAEHESNRESHEVVDMAEWQLVFRLCSICLQYPDASRVLQDELNEVLEYLETPEIKNYFHQFFCYLQETDLEELEQQYVHTFDFNDKTNLYITYSAMKEERERGEVLIQLKELYASLGYEMVTDDLSDYLPLFLEFLSVASIDMVKQVIEPNKAGIEALSSELQAIDSPYTFVLQACMITINRLTSKDGV